VQPASASSMARTVAAVVAESALPGRRPAAQMTRRGSRPFASAELGDAAGDGVRSGIGRVRSGRVRCFEDGSQHSRLLGIGRRNRTLRRPRPRAPGPARGGHPRPSKGECFGAYRTPSRTVQNVPDRHLGGRLPPPSPGIMGRSARTTSPDMRCPAPRCEPELSATSSVCATDRSQRPDGPGWWCGHYAAVVTSSVSHGPRILETVGCRWLPRDDRDAG
jgi:hypothetical protein